MRVVFVGRTTGFLERGRQYHVIGELDTEDGSIVIVEDEKGRVLATNASFVQRAPAAG